jgi:hypothetical protein
MQSLHAALYCLDLQRGAEDDIDPPFYPGESSFLPPRKPRTLGFHALRIFTRQGANHASQANLSRSVFSDDGIRRGHTFDSNPPGGADGNDPVQLLVDQRRGETIVPGYDGCHLKPDVAETGTMAA